MMILIERSKYDDDDLAANRKVKVLMMIVNTKFIFVLIAPVAFKIFKVLMGD